DPARAESDLRKAIEIRGKKNDPLDDQLPITLLRVAQMCDKTDRYEEAAKLLEESVEKYAVQNRNDVMVSFPLVMLGDIHCKMGHNQEAEKDYLRALKVLDAFERPNSPRFSLALKQLVMIYKKTGQDQLAEKYQQRLDSLAPMGK
ncbi:MAG TPA: tetratricopeptide repeat protein, partial [Terriglobales bacterium]|nr:tetratricopeptide repeat protein [Terriglobales bacterium]